MISSVFNIATSGKPFPTAQASPVNRGGRPARLMTPGKIADMQNRYLAHIAERRAAGFERVKRGFINGLMAEYGISRSYTEWLLAGLRGEDASASS